MKWLLTKRWIKIVWPKHEVKTLDYFTTGKPSDFQALMPFAM